MKSIYAWIPFAPYFVAAILTVISIHSLFSLSTTLPIVVYLFFVYAFGQIIAMALFWTLDLLSQEKKYAHLRAFFSARDNLPFAQKSDRVGNIVAFFGSWFYVAGVAYLIATGRHRKKKYQAYYRSLHLSMWKFAACITPVASISCVYWIIQ